VTLFEEEERESGEREREERSTAWKKRTSADPNEALHLERTSYRLREEIGGEFRRG